MKKQFEFLKRMLQSKVRDEKGATMVEYGLMLALIAVTCVGMVGLVGDQALLTFTGIRDALLP